MGLCLDGHLLYLFFAQARAGFNLNGLLLACTEVLCRNAQDTIGVDIKRNLNLWNASRSRRYLGKLESAERAVVGSKFPLSLQDVDVDGGLTIGSGGEDFLLAGWNSSVSVNQSCHNTAECLDAQRKGRYIQKQNVFYACITREHRPLNGGTQGNDLVGIDAFVRLFSEDVLDDFLNFWNSCRATNEQYLDDIAGVKFCILQRLMAWVFEPFQNGFHERLELAACDGNLQVLWPRGVGGDKG